MSQNILGNMKKVIKEKMLGLYFNKVFHVLPYQKCEENDNGGEEADTNNEDGNKPYDIPLYYQGRLMKKDPNEICAKGAWAKFSNKVSIAPLDGQHRIYAIAEIMAAEEDSTWTQTVDVDLICYIPKKIDMTTFEGTKYVRCMRALSKTIEEEQALTLNTTLIDALENVARIEDVYYLEDFYNTNHPGSDNHRLLFAQQNIVWEEEEKEPRMFRNFEALYRNLAKSATFLEVFRSRWSSFKSDNDFKAFFWRKEEGFFLGSTECKKYFTTEQKMLPKNMILKLTGEYMNMASTEKTPFEAKLDSIIDKVKSGNGELVKRVVVMCCVLFTKDVSSYPCLINS